MTNEILIFDDSKASIYRKTTETICHRSNDPIRYDKRSKWGSYQRVDGPGWVMIEITDGKPNHNVYGCEFGEFEDTYIPSGSGRPHHYIKKATVAAYQPGYAFRIVTRVDGKTESDASADASSWAVRNPSGVIYHITDVVFQASHALV